MYISVYCALLLVVATTTFAVPVKQANACGYESCNLGNPSMINVHLVPHTHDDVGWLKTVDQYYYGARDDIQIAGVQHILDAVIEALDENPDRRFIYVEMGFFWRWWLQQSGDIQDKVIQFVNQGRFEFISGGWCMNDEAATHYNSIIDQHTLGAQFLRDQFGECGRPKIGWQIDPFGHSREFASLISQMGFDGLFFARADYQDILTRNATRKREMIWKASANLDRQSWIFTGILPNGYGPPGSFCYDFHCADPPIMDNVNLHDYNVPERVDAFLKAAQLEAAEYSTKNLIMTFGSDFQYQTALANFKNMDKLIKYVNQAQANGSNVNVFYSTPSCYLYALNKADRAWTSKTDDFFPYAHHPHGFWTGYFTSRPALKRYERLSNNILQVTRQLNAFAKAYLGNNIFILSEAMGVAQHHDAVSGTEKQEVAFDYAQRLGDGINIAQGVISRAYEKLLPKSGQPTPAASQFLCLLSNISQCVELDGKDRFTLTLWNPTIHPVTQHVRVPVRTDYTVRDPTGQNVFTELIPITEPVFRIPGRTSVTQKEIIFAANLPALGFNTYYFEKKPENENTEKSSIKITANEECVLQNQNLRVQIDAQGNLRQITNLNQTIAVTFANQGFYWYQGYPGNGSGSVNQASGAYIFRPFSQTPNTVSSTRTVTCIRSETVQTAVIVFNDWASQEISLYNGGEMVDIEWTVGPIPVDDQVGKEIIVRYDSDIASQSTYYTDANGREVLQRTRNYRPTWNYTVAEPVSGNYYPINSRIWIKDGTRQLTILTDRSQGGGSIRDGSVEIMLHRRLLYDDRLGVAEPLNETAFGVGLVVRGRHSLILQKPETSALYHRVASQRAFMHPVATYALTQLSYNDYSNAYHQTWSALTDQLPLNVHLLTFDQIDPNNYLVRLENYFELNEDDTYSHPVTMNLQSIFQSIGTISNMVELALAGNVQLSAVQRLNWTTDAKESSYAPNNAKAWSVGDTSVRLTPMQIRTYQVTVA